MSTHSHPAAESLFLRSLGGGRGASVSEILIVKETDHAPAALGAPESERLAPAESTRGAEQEAQAQEEEGEAQSGRLARPASRGHALERQVPLESLLKQTRRRGRAQEHRERKEPEHRGGRPPVVGH